MSFYLKVYQLMKEQIKSNDFGPFMMYFSPFGLDSKNKYK